MLTCRAANIGDGALVAGQYHFCALLKGGSVACWGWNGDGQLGTGSTNDLLLPTPVYLGEGICGGKEAKRQSKTLKWLVEVSRQTH